MSDAHSSAIEQHIYSNGLVLLAETMPGVQSAAFTLLLPAGVAYEGAEGLDLGGGAATMAADWITRGAGDRDSRELLTALDNLGVSHAEGAQTFHTSLAAATLGRNLEPALEIFADIVLDPHLDDGLVEPIRALCLQGLRSLEDDPSSKVIHELRRRHFPDPLGRPVAGESGGRRVPDAGRDPKVPRGDLSAQRLDPRSGRRDRLAPTPRRSGPALRRLEVTLRAPDPPLDRPVRAATTCSARPSRSRSPWPIPAATVDSPDYYSARAAEAILGGYSSSRLFTEVREKRGLCYSVYASYEGQHDRAAVLCHAGTSPDRAQQTLDVMLAELERLARDGVAPEELETMRGGAQELPDHGARVRACAARPPWPPTGFSWAGSARSPRSRPPSMP